MRILFPAAPGYGLMLPLVPLVWAARAAGHEILIATTAHMAKAAAWAGAPVVDVFPLRDVGEDLVAGPDAPGCEDDPRLPEGYWELARAIRPFELFTLAMTRGTVDAGRDFGADLVVYCSDHQAGKLAAVALGVPALEVGNRVSWSMRDPGVREAARTNPRFGVVPDDSPVVLRLREALGLGEREPDLLGRIDPRAPSLGGLEHEEADPYDGVPWLPMRYVPYNGGAVLPDWALRKAARPRICLTLGTVAPLLPGGTEALRLLIDALAALDAEVVLADDETDLSALGPLPANLIPAGFVPLSGILRDCALVVHHGGSGTTAAALHYGVPQLLVPSGADNELCARRVTDRGVGLAVPPATADAARIAEAAARLLTEESFRHAAGQVRHEMAGQPSPAELIDRITAGAAA
ncbi:MULTISPECIES: nucleotide disphospho-sugar-binding domain-containing protein [unclassified Streptomyces]|uniref:nucleotide disphospho-sugar-binding domain-containing protein n=1 Tax=unclassified Streptomyces TaxID=2593676 RepID=UPI000ADC52D8|nr:MULTISPECIES: nucleotide disphospho-sugar-binding domain-containing protein [unclassified Streptomyces]